MNRPTPRDRPLLLDGRAAERCPVALDAEVVGLQPEQPSDVVVKWRDAAQAHRTSVTQQLLKSSAHVAVIDGTNFDARALATAQAMDQGLEIIIGPR
ncbi:MAG: hypothetical protein WCK25_03025, partial [Actinomycetes bacterium]